MFGLIASTLYNKNRLKLVRKIDSALSYAPRTEGTRGTGVTYYTLITNLMH